MAIGTAGFTAMLCVDALLNHGIKPPEDGPVLVTGASGGVETCSHDPCINGVPRYGVTGRPEEAAGSIKRSVWTRLLTVPSSPVPETVTERTLGCRH